MHGLVWMQWIFGAKKEEQEEQEEDERKKPLCS